MLLIDEKYELDIFYCNDIILNKDGIYKKIRRKYKSGIIVIEVVIEKGNFKIYKLKNYLFEEAFILIGNYWLDFNYIKLI